MALSTLTGILAVAFFGCAALAVMAAAPIFYPAFMALCGLAFCAMSVLMRLTRE